MPSVCLTFQLHQAQRLNPYSALDIGRSMPYFDQRYNRQSLHDLSDRGILPANKQLLSLIKAHEGAFRVAFSLSGMLLDQLESMRPDVLRSFVELAETGCVEFLGGTHYHSLAFVYSREEFFRQVILHKEKLWQHFRQDPLVFANTELIYNNQLAYFVRQMGFRGVLAEGVAALLKGRTANQLFLPPDLLNMQLLLRNSLLTEGLAFPVEGPAKNNGLNPLELARRVHAQSGDLVNVCLNYADFAQTMPGTSQDFLKAFPPAVLRDKNWRFELPAEVIRSHTAKEHYSANDYISGVDQSRDLTPWRANELQEEALQKVYELESVVLGSRKADVIHDWSLLQAAEHFYYMSLKEGADALALERIRPFANAYDAYLAFMNVIADFQLKLRHADRR